MISMIMQLEYAISEYYDKTVKSDSIVGTCWYVLQAVLPPLSTKLFDERVYIDLLGVTTSASVNVSATISQIFLTSAKM